MLSLCNSGMASVEVSSQLLRLPTQPSSLSSKHSNPLRTLNAWTLPPRPRRRGLPTVLCSVAPSQLQSPAAPAAPADAVGKKECFGVFRTTYDLKEEEKTKSWKSLVRIAVSGAAGMISNHLLFKVLTNANPYGIADDIVFSMPCRSKGDGDYELIKDVTIDDFLRERIKKTEAELLAEKRCVGHLTGEGNEYCDLPGDTMLPGEQ